MKTKKILALTLAAVLLVAVGVGGTLAWLQDTSKQIVNTFSPSNIEVKLEESKSGFQIIPSVDIEKDPKVTASSNVAYYVFVKIEKANWLDAFMSYEKAEGWDTLTSASTDNITVIYKTLDADEVLTNDSVLKGDIVKVDSSMTEGDMPSEPTLPTLTFTAYAIQQQGFDTVADAWTAAQNLANDGVVNVQ